MIPNQFPALALGMLVKLGDTPFDNRDLTHESSAAPPNSRQQARPPRRELVAHQKKRLRFPGAPALRSNVEMRLFAIQAEILRDRRDPVTTMHA
jgi:hypothetical protein